MKNMYITISDESGKHPLDQRFKDGFFVVAVGESAQNYSYRRAFSLYEISCCSKITFADVESFSEHKCRTNDEKTAQKQCKHETLAIAKKCTGKQLYVLSELDDIYAADQCYELAKSTGEDGLSVLITHIKNRELFYFEKVRTAFDSIVYLPDGSEYTLEVLRWLVCGFSIAGLTGTDYDDAHYILTQNKESICRKIQFCDSADMKSSFMDFVMKEPIMCDNGNDVVNRLIGVWMPHDYDVNDISYLGYKIDSISNGEVSMSLLYNEHESDISWTIIMLSNISNATTNEE